MNLNASLGAGITVWIALTFILTSFLGLERSKLTALRLILTLFGVALGASIAWFKRRKAPPAAGAATGGTPADDLASLLGEAENKLAASAQAGHARLRDLAAILVTGPAGSAKTSVVLHSALEPELIAGQVHQNEALASTAVANVWLTREAAVIEAGAPIQGDAKTWSTLGKRLLPGKWQALRGVHASARAVVVCLECESFLGPGAAERAVETGKAIRSHLLSLGGALGVSLPVYVLFTKLDRLAFFPEYVRTLDDREAAQILGASIPPAPSVAGGYGERETARLTEQFSQLALSLSNKRTDLLVREGDKDAVLSAYEFPREFRKLRTPLVSFLVELCRPSQLNQGPVLRGFYFTGVRPVVVEDEVAAQAVRAPVQQAVNPEATSMFRAQAPLPAAPAARPGRTRRRIPQWVFLPRLFSDVVLGDKAGRSASASSSHSHWLRRLVFSAVIASALVLLAGITVSFFGNRQLATDVRTAASGVVADAGAKIPSVESLSKLDDLRQALLRLRQYEEDGPPLRLRWGLYSGSELLPDARRLYFDRFATLLFTGVQSGLVDTMKSWPAAPAANADYGYSYDTLKAYLETTSNHDKATMQFLPAVLDARWAAGQTVDPARQALARKQWDFYTSELIRDNPYPSNLQASTVASARQYLAQFAGVSRVYQAMLTGANAANKSLIFNQKFPGSAATVINSREVPGAFSKDGFAWMQAAIKDPGKYVSGEQWVLGEGGAAVRNTPELQHQILALYEADFINTWRDYLRRSSVVRYASLPDAAKKLALLSAPQSPLLALFWLPAQNTAVADPAIAKAFKPLYAFMPTTNVDQYVGPSNTNYMTGLTALQSSVDAASKLPVEQVQAAADQVNNAATTALLTTHQTALTFGLDADAHIESVIEKLLEAPITFLDAVKPNGASPAPLNGAGAEFCGKYKALTAKFPFDSNAAAKATVDDVNAVFRPQSGVFWAFYTDKLAKMLPKTGSSYTPVPGGKPALTPRFVSFFNNAAKFSDALYANGTAQDPKLTFALQPVFSTDLQSINATVDGQSVTFHPGSTAQQFSWPGTGGVRLTAHSGGSDFLYPNYDGLWGIFEFFNDADRSLPSPEWMLKSGKSDKPVTSPVTNQPIVVRFTVDMLGNPPVFQKGYFHELTCVAEVAR